MSGLTLTKIGKKANFSSLHRRNFATAKFGFKTFKDQSEWVGNQITFDISRVEGKTYLTFTQVGLTPAYECYDACQYAWTGFIQKSLFSLITTGKALPKWYE